jgi:hypothetical protein
MIQVTQLRARSFDLDHVDVFWEVADYFGDPRQYSFTILRSESFGGPWEQLKTTVDEYYFRDTSPSLLHKWRTLFYLLRVKDLVSSEEKEFGPTAQIPEPDLIALEIMRQEDVLFREFVGRRCWLFPVRTFGAKCVCYDRVAGRRSRSNCLTCYDTGFLGGYMSPIECFIQFDPESKSEQLTSMMEQEALNTSARLLASPFVKPKDIFVESENRRWKINSVSGTERLRAVVHQEITLHEIPKGDIEYKLPVNITDLRALSPSAERNFTNPQHRDNDGNVKSLLAVYGYKPRGAAG